MCAKVPYINCLLPALTCSPARPGDARTARPVGVVRHKPDHRCPAPARGSRSTTGTDHADPLCCENTRIRGSGGKNASTAILSGQLLVKLQAMRVAAPLPRRWEDSCFLKLRSLCSKHFLPGFKTAPRLAFLQGKKKKKRENRSLVFAFPTSATKAA